MQSTLQLLFLTIVAFVAGWVISAEHALRKQAEAALVVSSSVQRDYNKELNRLIQGQSKINAALQTNSKQINDLSVCVFPAALTQLRADQLDAYRAAALGKGAHTK